MKTAWILPLFHIWRSSDLNRHLHFYSATRSPSITTKTSEAEPTLKSFAQRKVLKWRIRSPAHSKQTRDFNTISNSLQPAAKLRILTLWKEKTTENAKEQDTNHIFSQRKSPIIYSKARNIKAIIWISATWSNGECMTDQKGQMESETSGPPLHGINGGAILRCDG